MANPRLSGFAFRTAKAWQAEVNVPYPSPYKNAVIMKKTGVVAKNNSTIAPTKQMILGTITMAILDADQVAIADRGRIEPEHLRRLGPLCLDLDGLELREACANRAGRRLGDVEHADLVRALKLGLALDPVLLAGGDLRTRALHEVVELLLLAGELLCGGVEQLVLLVELDLRQLLLVLGAERHGAHEHGLGFEVHRCELPVERLECLRARGEATIGGVEPDRVERGHLLAQHARRVLLREALVAEPAVRILHVVTGGDERVGLAALDADRHGDVELDGVVVLRRIVSPFCGPFSSSE